MRRLYYIADTVEDTEAVSNALMNEGIKRLHLHVLAKDEAGLYTHKIHSATPIQQLDIIHTGARYALLGAVAGALLGTVIYGLAAAGVLRFDMPVWVILALAGLGTCFGAWEGGMVGLSRENYKIERYHEDIEAGRYLIMVDVSKEQRPLVKELMNMDFAHVPYRGGTSTFVSVLERPKVMHHQTTH